MLNLNEIHRRLPVLYQLRHSNHNTTPLSTSLVNYHKECTSVKTAGIAQNKSRQKNNFIADAIEKVLPSVVYIEGTTSTNNGKAVRNSTQKGRSKPQDKVEKVSGSGFVATENGIILTCAHVCHNSNNFKVTFSNGKQYDAYVIDADHDIDLAAVKISCKNPNENFPVVKLGEYSELRVGEWVIAMGSPLGLSNTVTSGIVSTLDRSLSGIPEIAGPMIGDKVIHYIQTDAAINIGNSGGPLINLDGEVIGVNSMTIFPANGISFAIPSDIASGFLEQAIKIEESFSQGGVATSKYPKGEKFFIGLSMLTLTPSIVHQLQSRNSEYDDLIAQGVLVMRVNTNSPAERGGLNELDIITAVNGKPVSSTSDIFGEVQKGERMMLFVNRGKTKIILYVDPQIQSRL